MGKPDFQKIIQDFYKYFGVSLKSLTFSFNNQIPVGELDNGEVVKGLRNIISKVSKANCPELDVVQDQWAEYILTNVGNLKLSVAPPLLKELNCYMADKVVFVGTTLGPIDILMYYLLYNIMINLSYEDKEKYLHISRWFNFVQQDKGIRVDRTVVPFSRICIYA